MQTQHTGTQAWAGFYQDLENPINFFPENFVARIFLSENPVKFLEKDYEGKRILDIGCGHGRHIPFLQSLGMDVEGLEVSDDQVQKLQTTFPHLKFHNGKSSDITAPDEYFDYLLACNSIYYVDSIEDGFAANIDECRRVLKPDRYFILSMVGHQHALLKGAQHNNGYAQITQDFLGVRDGIWIRPLWEKEDMQTLCPGFNIIKSGEILETCEGFNRHIHYFLAQKI